MNKGVLRIFVGSALAAMLLMLSACGSDDESSVTKSQFIKEGNSICKKWQEEREKLFTQLGAEVGQNPSQADQENAVIKILTPYEAAVEEVGELTPPEGEEAKIEAILAAMEEGVERVEADPGSAITGNNPFKKANDLVAAYGLEECNV